MWLQGIWQIEGGEGGDAGVRFRRVSNVTVKNLDFEGFQVEEGYDLSFGEKNVVVVEVEVSGVAMVQVGGGQVGRGWGEVDVMGRQRCNRLFV